MLVLWNCVKIIYGSANVALVLARFGISVEFAGYGGPRCFGSCWLTYCYWEGKSLGCTAPTRIFEVRCLAVSDRTFGRFLGDDAIDFADPPLVSRIYLKTCCTKLLARAGLWAHLDQRSLAASKQPSLDAGYTAKLIFSFPVKPWRRKSNASFW